MKEEYVEVFLSYKFFSRFLRAFSRKAFSQKAPS